MVADFQLSSGPCEREKLNEARFSAFAKIKLPKWETEQQEILDRISREFLT